jgi:hypothetical protein
MLVRPGLFEVTQGRGGPMLYITRQSIDYVETNGRDTINIHMRGRLSAITVYFSDKTVSGTNLNTVLRELSDTVSRPIDFQENVVNTLDRAVMKLETFEKNIRAEMHEGLAKVDQQLANLEGRLTYLEDDVPAPSTNIEQDVAKPVSDPILWLITSFLVALGVASFMNSKQWY